MTSITLHICSLRVENIIPNPLIICSSYVLIMTAIDRYQAICYPLTNCTWTPRRSNIMIGVAWVISLLLSIPQATIFKHFKYESAIYPNMPKYDCRAVSMFVVLFMSLSEITVSIKLNWFYPNPLFPSIFLLHISLLSINRTLCPSGVRKPTSFGTPSPICLCPWSSWSSAMAASAMRYGTTLTTKPSWQQQLHLEIIL